jgi:hypothetical protein
MAITHRLIFRFDLFASARWRSVEMMGELFLDWTTERRDTALRLPSAFESTRLNALQARLRQHLRQPIRLMGKLLLHARMENQQVVLRHIMKFDADELHLRMCVVGCAHCGCDGAAHCQ